MQKLFIFLLLVITYIFATNTCEMKQNAILIDKFSKENNDWKFEKIDIPEPKEGEVQIKIVSSAINPVDWKLKHGYLSSFYETRFPVVLGWDLSGKISKVGYGVSQFTVGEEVYAYARRQWIGKHAGTYCEYICLPSSFVAKKPKKFDHYKSAGVPLTSLTAYQSFFDKAKAKKGEKVLILGASGGVGSWAVQYARIMGLTSIAVASTKNHEYLKKIGATHTVDYKSDVVAEVKKLVGEVDIVLDFFGSEGLEKTEVLVKKEGGRMVGICDGGFKSKRDIPYHFVFVVPNATQLTQIAVWIDEEKLTLNLEHAYDFKDIAKAIAHIQKGGIRGKIALKINP